jgi:hypothetical protein
MDYDSIMFRLVEELITGVGNYRDELTEAGEQELREAETVLLNRNNAFSESTSAGLVASGAARRAAWVARYLTWSPKSYLSIARKYARLSGTDSLGDVKQAYQRLDALLAARELGKVSLRKVQTTVDEWMDAWAACKDAEIEVAVASKKVADEMAARIAVLKRWRTNNFRGWNSYFERAYEPLKNELKIEAALTGWRRDAVVGTRKEHTGAGANKRAVTARTEALERIATGLGGLEQLGEVPAVPEGLPVRGDLVHEDSAELVKTSPLYVALPLAIMASGGVTKGGGASGQHKRSVSTASLGSLEGVGVDVTPTRVRIKRSRND